MRCRVVAIHQQRDEGDESNRGKGGGKIIHDDGEGEQQFIRPDPGKNAEQDVGASHGNARNQQRPNNTCAQRKEPPNQRKGHGGNPAKTL